MKRDSKFKLLGGVVKNFISDEIIDDKKNFKDTIKTLNILGVDSTLVFSILASLLHLSNIEFDDSGAIHETSKSSLQVASQLLMLETEHLEFGLTQKVSSVGRGEKLVANLTKVQAEQARDSIIVPTKFKG